MIVSRRGFLRFLGSALALGAATSAYGVIIEPFFRLRTTRYALTPPGWPADFPLRIAIVTDIHACDPWMNEGHIDDIVAMTNDAGADVILLLGDYIATHDWWNDQRAMVRGQGLPAAGLALQDAGVPVYQNQSVRLVKDGRAFWLAGLGDQIAFIPQRGRRHPKYGIDDLPATLAQVTDDAPVLLLAHEPDIFPQVPARVSLTLSGHTHGGQISLFGWTPVVPSRYGSRYAYGHKVEDGRHIIISSGLGCSGIPVRIGAAPEVVVIDLGGPATS